MSESESKQPGFVKYLDNLVDSLRTLVGKVSEGDQDVVHQARVTTRRLKAALDLLDPVLTKKSRKPFARVTRTLRKRLGPLRDLDVMSGHLKELDHPKTAEAVHWLSNCFEDSRQKAVKKAAGDLSPARILAKLGSWWGVREEITHADEAIDSLIAQSVHLQLDAFIEQSEGLARSDDTRTDPHQLRIAGKSLRYTLEMARQHCTRLPAGTTALFKRMQDALGLWHDYVVLADRVLCESSQQQLALHNLEVQQAALSLASLALGRARHQLERVAELWQRQGEELAGAIRRAFSITTEPTMTIPSADVQPAAPAA